MSLGDAGKNKDIRARAEEFLEHGVLGCCPEVKEALGKTIADANAPKQPEKKLPNVQNHNGRRFDPSGKWQEGMTLNLFPTPTSQADLSGQPNFGWVPKLPTQSSEEASRGFAEKLRKLANGPRVVQEVWEVDKEGNPTKLVKASDPNDASNSDVQGKGLGRTLREMNPGNTLVARAAKKFGVWVDDLGKFRCPPGTPQANQFTDEYGTTCFAVSASEIINAAQEGFASLGEWWRRSRQRRLPFFIDEYGNITENVDIAQGRQEYRRVFTGARSRVRARIAELEGNVADLLKMHNIELTPGSNDDLKQLIQRLAPQMDLHTFDADAIWDMLDPRTQKSLMARGINKQALVDSERGFLMKITELAVTDPERLSKIKSVIADPRMDTEAVTNVLDPMGKAIDVQYEISYNPISMSQNVTQQLMEVRENQRLGLRVANAATDEEAADALHEFVVNENQWAGGMSASLGKNMFITKGAHTSMHEISHTIQIDKVAQVLVEQKGASVRFSDVNNAGLFQAMTQMDDELNLDDLGLVLSDLERVAFMGGRYGADEWERSGAVSELWKVEASAELYALREMGVIEGDDVDMALSWMDDIGSARTMEMRQAAKKKNIKRIEKAATKPLVRPDGSRDHPGAPPPKRPRKARVVKDPKAADIVGKSLRKSIMDNLDDNEKEVIDRIGDPRSHQVISLVNPDEMSQAILSIDSSHKIARKYGVDLDEIDVSDSEAVDRVAYDAKKKRLYVTYSSPDGGPGRTYYYRDVEPETVLDLHKAEVKGRAINEIKATHQVERVDKFPEKIDHTSLEDADIASQVQFNLIPALTALDKAEIGREMRVVVSIDKSKGGGEIADMRGITTARIYHDGISLNDDEVVLSLPADARGIPFNADVFDREAEGSTTMMMIPPMRVAVLDDKEGRRAELIEQPSSDSTLNRMIDQWPSGRDAKEGRILNSSRRKVEEVVASHIAAGEGDDSLPDGSTTPIGARRIRVRNADIHERQTKKRSAPTRPTRAYGDSFTPTGFHSIGKPETPEERKFSRTYGNATLASALRNDVTIDPEIQRMIGNMDDRKVSQVVEATAVDFHNGIDRRPRLRMSTDEVDKLIQDGGRHYSDRGHFSNAERAYHATIGIHPDTEDIDRPVGAYVVHPSQDLAARNALRQQGKIIGDAPIEWPQGKNPHGDVDADGDIEIILKPEVSGRTAYGRGYGIDNKTRPVWMNSAEGSDVADALMHFDSEKDPDTSKTQMLNALSASIDGNFGYLTDTGSVKPASTSQNENTEEFVKRTADHIKASRPERLGAQIMGGFVNEEIADIRLPWSHVSKNASDMDISDVVKKEPISDRLRRLGFTDQEIEYFYKVNGDRSLDHISSATMSSLKEYRKAMQMKKEYEARGIPSVSFAHPTGFDPLDVSSYAADPTPGMTVEDALSKAINEEVDALVEKMLKQVRKTRGKLWEMKPKAGAST